MKFLYILLRLAIIYLLLRLLFRALFYGNYRDGEKKNRRVRGSSSRINEFEGKKIVDAEFEDIEEK